ncbi:MAG: sigma-70 family RNA polymerase sigma factor [Acidobacteriota bacterium]|nr:sigma-70 family RNA polymerase sigma factor [Acidobacteriota bacterium]
MSAVAAVVPMLWGLAAERPRGQRRPPMRARCSGGPMRWEERRMGMEAYRQYTEALLRRYTTMSLEVGRTPSLLGRELFRGKVTTYRVRSFDDVVIFVHDVERCVERLEQGQQDVLRRLAVEEYTLHEAAKMLQLGVSTVIRRYGRALDALSAIFLEVKLLEPLLTCQEDDEEEERLSC